MRVIEFFQNGGRHENEWKKMVGEKLLNLWAEETIQISIDNAKTPKEKTAVYRTLKVQLEQQGEVTNFKLIII